MANELLELTVAEAAERIRSGELSAEEYFDAWRERAAGDSLNAYLWRAEDAGQADLDGSRAAHEENDGDRSLAGIPVAIKDIFCAEGIPTTAGSRILEGYRPPYTATAVRNLRRAGDRAAPPAGAPRLSRAASRRAP